MQQIQPSDSRGAPRVESAQDKPTISPSQRVQSFLDQLEEIKNNLPEKFKSQNEYNNYYNTLASLYGNIQEFTKNTPNLPHQVTDDLTFASHNLLASVSAHFTTGDKASLEAASLYLDDAKSLLEQPAAKTATHIKARTLE